MPNEPIFEVTADGYRVFTLRCNFCGDAAARKRMEDILARGLS